MAKPLDGLRVIEVGQLLAGPFAGSMLAYFGAEVIKVEPPGGDPIRGWRELNQGTSFWWYSLARNKKSVCIDLKQEDGRAILKELLGDADVLVENFRPGVMEDWGLGPDDIKSINPGLVYARISGYGQDGPNATKPGFASVCEAYSGFRHVNGFPNEAPVRPNLSIGDTIAGIHAALGIALALLERQKSGEGQTIDVALYEAMFNLLEAVVPEYSGAGAVREASGTTVTGIVPTNTYRCGDGKFVVIGGNGDSIFKRLMTGIGHSDLAEDPRLANNAGRVEHEEEIDQILSGWCSARPIADVLSVMAEQRVPAGPIYNVEDMLEDPHYQARGMFERVEIDGKPLDIPAILPKLGRTPGRTEWVGPELGAHNQEVLQGLGKSADDITRLQSEGVVG
ncbi:CaiB/BaiF CoA transferase family protein [Pseudoteredinibacter isoporae]|uniref:Crotonobetainyl-CoA:carnitine CoA-transferase CaiB-like acyl-CoA transferase n=1 Tax=Pseudoteredinibacter isoporae TaxID=570281 RepID=A0A7X0JWW9_9GAMM|nr:CaiB/BaiF CoA-transferase family protein [Pseudoteredinibacter isoporae]MBB6522911.1 crotonobetainyl-CoA:carnitine CoA-transferase CaiB-like acyl-CoA transferase [Pseudoteredinibacter isoporae]NHO88437.1 CoA transferase [Pseudoteredinibacter isoporae]NIB23232.1 CoA transferase [Pseudoteredinibacter isoporae]